ncbi:classical arabinogalactan protein 26 [Mercurialis annua]|uniref:classical arabinogalactan protein 26 n=1 Tax=Mercurialis annua TaxID=3986 RepID=UPI0021608B16|nr:classical arabinogalactan protein 26 [Mercurialis annua]XP_050203814.1 classical arabinogalactan protein 26 [Mercurialis annua]
MASFSSFFPTLMLFIITTHFSTTIYALNSKLVQFSTISAAPAILPESPLSSPSPTQALSPDIQPILPTTGGASVPSPADSSLPTIPANPSPPNPDVFYPEAPGPEDGISPSGSLPVASAVCLSSWFGLHFLGVLVFCLVQGFGL